MTGVAYADASALVKLILLEADSGAVHRWFTEAPRIATSRVGVVETIRASSRRIHDAVHRGRVLEEVEIIDLNIAIAAAAAALHPPLLRTLDAIHLATAMALMPELDAFVTYDDRMAEAARALGLPVVRPA
jgi:predicted nucleic acid-binding protein